MPTIAATVTWPRGQTKPSVSPNPINVPSGDGQTTITWSAGSGVATFSISGLDSGEFDPASCTDQTSFSSTDKNNDSTEYSYTVTATRSTGETAGHDPKIQNGAT